MSKTKKITYFALLIAAAFVLSYLESLIPYNFGIPGIKLGLSNLAVVIALYTISPFAAFAVSMVKTLLSGLVFSGAFSLTYGFSGAVLSYLIMLLLKKTGKVGTVGVSAAGGAVFNIGQVIVAAAVMKNAAIFSYLPVLLVTGCVAGVAVGAVSGVIVKRLQKVLKKDSGGLM